jgi:hypothetical protein
VAAIAHDSIDHYNGGLGDANSRGAGVDRPKLASYVLLKESTLERNGKVQARLG